MLSKNKIKFLQSLERKKIRDQERLFLVEGDKMVNEAIRSGFAVELICATEAFLISNSVPPDAAGEIIRVTHDELEKASLLQSPKNALAVVKIPDHQFSKNSIARKLSLALDCIQDPGNVGTLIRIADWFGIEQLLCSKDTADCYNPKVVQASMGAIFRVKVHYLDLKKALREAVGGGIPVFGTFLDGEIVYKHPLASEGILVMGNEGNGISPQVEELIAQRLFIPPYPEGQKNSESLNVATAAAICCAEFRRRMIIR
jgi:TrmH family RNA methyltransferase